MDVEMIKLNYLHEVLYNVNNEIWEVIRELHEMEDVEELKNKLINVSGELCTEIIIPVERELGSDCEFNLE